MKIQKEFVPITIVIETELEYKTLENVFHLALRYLADNFRYSDAIDEKVAIISLLDRLKS